MATTLRLKFERTGPVRYIGHLDMLRYFQKAVMRAGIDIRYSEGFNPHQIMSFAYPLGVSMETKGDYLDIDVLSYTSCEEIVHSLNEVMSEGIRIVGANVLPENTKNAMASVAAADYLVHISSGSVSECDIEQLLVRHEILVGREGKGGVVMTDIRPGIFELKLCEDNILFMKLQSGSEKNIKPSAILEKLSEITSKPVTTDRIIRLEIYEKDEQGGLKPLGNS